MRRTRTLPSAARAATGVIAGCLLMAACSSGGQPGGAGQPPTTLPAITVAPTTSASSPTTVPTAPSPGSEWITYHSDNARLGAIDTQPSLDPIRVAWRATLDGSAVYGQPLVADGRVLVATEDDDVFALDPATGRVIWQESLGQPLRDVVGQAGCGDIDPLGITSTPVVDNATDTLYVVAEVSVAGRQPVHHELAGIDINSGRVTFEADADPPVPAGENVVHLLQRAALLLANGRVYVSYGGQYGDCGDYHGWVVGVPTDGAPRTAFNITPDSSGGAVWQGGGGPSVDAAGNIYVSTGNPNSSGPAPWAEAVVKLSPTLTSPPEAAFQDRYATGDLDLATGDVVVLPNGEVFAVGKTDIPYLLTQDHLVDAGHFSGRVCGSDPDGGAAYDSLDNSLYVPCQDGGLSEVNLTDRHIRSFAVGVNSAPILVDGELWALSYPSGRLEEVDPRSGSVLQKISVGQDVPHFASPSAAGGLLLVGTTAGIVAFTGPGGPTLG